MTRTLLALSVFAALLAGAADAQDKSKKLYRWVDKDGKVQFSDSLPAEAVDQARTEISAESGRATASLDRAMTAEEREAYERELAETQRVERDAEQKRKTEEAMLASFQTEDDLRRSFQVRVTLMQENLNAIEAGIGSQRASLTSLLAEASEAELAGRAVNHKQAAAIVELHREMAKQQQMLVLKQGELMGLDEELEYLVKRFHELKGPRAAEVAPPAEGAAPAG